MLVRVEHLSPDLPASRAVLYLDEHLRSGKCPGGRSGISDSLPRHGAPLTDSQNTLTYGCVCGNGLQPNISEYSLTLPFYVCQEWGNQCVKACGQNNQCSGDCRDDHPCGALNPTRVNSTTASTMSATGTTSTNEIFTGLAGGSSSGTPQGNVAPALASGGAVGLVVVIGGLVGGLALLL